MWRRAAPRLIGRPTHFITPRRGIKLSALGAAAIKGWGPFINIIGGAYIGGLIVCFGLLYLMYHDADQRQPIPFELKFNDQVEAVKAINKDDVCHSPRHAVKHYRKLLLELAKENGVTTENDKTDATTKYDVPILSSDVLVYKKLAKFANFYVDIVLRYAKALLAKGQPEALIHILEQMITNDTIFYKLGDAERLSQCARLLSRLEPKPEDKQGVLDRDLDMLIKTYDGIDIDQYRIQSDSKVTDEVLACLNDIAFTQAKQGGKHHLNTALNIYMANLKKLTEIKNDIDNHVKTQALFPAFDCDNKNLVLLINECKAHISEIMWAKGYKKNAIAWSEDVVNGLFPYHNAEPEVAPLLVQVLNNLDAMYANLKDTHSRNRCKQAKDQLEVFDTDDKGWYENFINRWSRIIWSKGPLGIIEKPLLERFGQPQPLPELEEIEPEDD